MAPDQPVRWARRWQHSAERQSADVRADHHFASPAALNALHMWLARLIDTRFEETGAPVTLIDAGAGSGEAILGTVPLVQAGRVCPVAMDRQPPPTGWPAGWHWVQSDLSGGLALPDGFVQTPGVVILALELLDEVPCDVAELHGGNWYYVEVDATGNESLGDPVTGRDLAWLNQWAPGAPRAEIGRSRDELAVAICRHTGEGVAIFIDYTIDAISRTRHPAGTLTGYYRGRQVPAVPDGRRNLTAHVAADSLISALRGVGRVSRSRLADVLGDITQGPFIWQDPLGSWGDFDVICVDMAR